MDEIKGGDFSQRKISWINTTGYNLTCHGSFGVFTGFEEGAQDVVGRGRPVDEKQVLVHEARVRKSKKTK